MSNESDKAGFDSHMAEIERLRQTSAGREAIALVEAGGRAFLAGVEATGRALGPVALAALQGLAVSFVEGQVAKLGGKRGG